MAINYKMVVTFYIDGAATGNEYFISSSNFQLEADGDITGSNVLFTGGKMGGWDITTSRINSPDGDMRLTSSNPKITIGTHTIGDGPGIQLGYDGSSVLTFFAGEGADDYFKYVAGSGVSIETDNFTLTTAGVITATGANITGDITVTNPHDFADPSASLSGSILYENFQDALDTNRWITGNLDQDIVGDTVGGMPYSGSFMYNSDADAWTAGFASKRIFIRNEGTTLSFDVCCNNEDPATMVGFVEDTFDASDITTGNNYPHMVVTVYFATSGDIKIGTGNGSSGWDGAPSAQFTNAWTDGEDTFFRCRLSMIPSGSSDIARVEIFKNGDYTSPAYAANIPDTYGNDGTRAFVPQLKAAVLVNNEVTSGAGNEGLIINQLAVNREVGPTRISGDTISTGKIYSNNWAATVGTLVDLDNEKIMIGGTGAATEGIVLDAGTSGVPKFFVGNTGGNYIKFNHTANKIEIVSDNFSVNSAGDVTMTGTVTAEAGSIGGFTIGGGAIAAGSNFYISGSASGAPTDSNTQNYFISASEFQVSADGAVSASNLLIVKDVSGTPQTMIDTSTGYVQGYNISRQLYQNSDEVVMHHIALDGEQTKAIDLPFTFS